jgi:hypothetical protein
MNLELIPNAKLRAILADTQAAAGPITDAARKLAAELARRSRNGGERLVPIGATSTPRARPNPDCSCDPKQQIVVIICSPIHTMCDRRFEKRAKR